MRRKKYLGATIIILMICIGVLTACTTNKNTLSKTVENALCNVLEIKCSEENKFDSVGTAFFIDKDHIITNAHIVTYKEADEYFAYTEIEVENGEYTSKATVEKFDRTKDIAILKVDIPKTNINVTVNQEALEYATDIFTIGNLNGMGLSCGIEIVSSPKKLIKKNGITQTFIQTNIEISAGNSGGPLYNYGGEIIGMVTFKLRDSNAEYVDGVCFAIPSSTFLEYYKL